MEIYFNSTDPDSSQARSTFAAMLDSYESSLSNRFDVNAGGAGYDVAEERDVAGMLVVSIVPLLLLILVFSSVMSIAAESVAGEKERGTMATLLATPIKRHDIALGKVLAITVIGLLIAASSAIGIFSGLPGIMQGSVDINVYGPVEYVLLALVILSTTLVIVALITVVSTLAKSVKEATMFLTPLMIVVMLVGVLGMFGDAKAEVAYYLVPLYNSVQCMIGIFSFDFQPLNVAVCVIANLAYAGASCSRARPAPLARYRRKKVGHEDDFQEQAWHGAIRMDHRAVHGRVLRSRLCVLRPAHRCFAHDS